MTQELRGLTVLVTRPRPEGLELSKRIDDMGGDAVYFPTIEIKPPANPTIFAEQVKHLAQFDWVIFVSRQAVYAFSDVFRGVFPAKVKVAAIGLGTANALKDAGIKVDCYPEDAWHSEGLLALAEFKDMREQHVALISGDAGREWLANELAERGAALTHLIAYERCQATADPTHCMGLLKTHQIDIILCTSNDILEHLVSIFGKHDVISVPLLVISERMVLLAKKLGFNTILLAENASHDVIMETLRGYLWQMKQNKHKQ